MRSRERERSKRRPTAWAARHNSDCTEPAFNQCCFFPPLDAGTSLQFCANEIIAAFAGAGAVCQ
jgi:hypothetical protein